ncbi:MAG: aminoacyl-tRNA hydrolase [Spirochaetes bacterium]|nr:aminoacyl-tRNA hydrolase [Spirochaetota bacterium]
MKIITCLGNPGKKYEKNRHNIGFLAADYLKNRYNFPAFREKFKALYSTVKINNEDVTLLLPQTFMNLSGESVTAALGFFKCSIEDLTVIHDELELEFGEVRLKKGGGHKGHNGIRSIMQLTGSSDFYRIRFGIGRPHHPAYSVADYVLADFSQDEYSALGRYFAEIDKILIENIL